MIILPPHYDVQTSTCAILSYLFSIIPASCARDLKVDYSWLLNYIWFIKIIISLVDRMIFPLPGMAVGLGADARETTWRRLPEFPPHPPNWFTHVLNGFNVYKMATPGKPHFVFPALHENPTGWGPCEVPEQFKDTPYQPFSKGDRLGKVKTELDLLPSWDCVSSSCSIRWLTGQEICTKIGDLRVSSWDTVKTLKINIFETYQTWHLCAVCSFACLSSVLWKRLHVESSI